jgi:menaquinol-cytochrome c reductase iron-sulfur subunit
MVGCNRGHEVASFGSMSTNETSPTAERQDRREFLKSAACCVLGGVCVVAPAVAGIVVLLGPLRKDAQEGTWVKLANVEALPKAGGPQLYEIHIERTDAWTRHARSAVGSVFLERLEDNSVRAFNSSCPHLGCSVKWQGDREQYYCPCHDSAFAKGGDVISPSASARGLDTLVVEIRGAGEVWVRFQDFKAGIKEKVPVA